METQETNTQAVLWNDGRALVCERKSSNGRTLGSRAMFSPKTAGDWRALGKSQNKKGKELDKFVNDGIKGHTKAAVVIGQAYMAGLIQAGYQPDYADVNNKQTKATITLVKAGAAAPKAADVDLVAMSAEEREALKQRLLGIETPAPAPIEVPATIQN